MSENLASAAHGGRLNNIQNDDASLELQRDASAVNGDGLRFHGDGQTGHSFAVREAIGSYALGA